MVKLLTQIATAVVALGLAPAARAAGWVSSGPLSPDDRIATQARVVITPTGERVVAWVQNVGNGFTPENISVRIAQTGSDFGATQTFSGDVASPQLAVGADGTVALAWVDEHARTVHIARREPGQPTFVEGPPLTVPDGETAFGVHVEFSGQDVIASFDSFMSDGPSSVWAARLAAASMDIQLLPGQAAGGAIDHQPFVAGQPSVTVGGSDLAVDGGQVYVSWAQFNEGTINSNGVTLTDGVTTVKYAKLGAAGSFAAPIPIDTETSNSEFPPQMTPGVAAAAGHAYVVWRRQFDHSPVRFQDVGTGGTALTVPTDDFFQNLQVAADASGTLFIAGQGTPPGTESSVVGVAIEPPGAPPTPAVRVTAAGIGRQLDDLELAADGTAIVLPDRVLDTFDPTVQVLASIRPSGGAFAPPQDVSGPQDGTPNTFDSPSAAVAAGGRAVVAWSATDHSAATATNQRLHVSEFDAAPPTFGAVSVPTTATTGQAVALSASASDLLSTTTIGWDFGDGSQATGAQVSHVYGEAGAATVTVSATDSAGNSVSQTRVIAVAPARPTVDRTPPVITALRLSHSRFRVGASHTAQLAAKQRRRPAKPSPAGTTLRLLLSEHATLAVEIRQRARPGRILRGTLVRAGTGPGAVAIAFSGRVGRVALVPGSYTATVIAIDGAGNRSRPKSLSFTIVAR